MIKADAGEGEVIQQFAAGGLCCVTQLALIASRSQQPAFPLSLVSLMLLQFGQGTPCEKSYCFFLPVKYNMSADACKCICILETDLDVGLVRHGVYHFVNCRT